MVVLASLRRAGCFLWRRVFFHWQVGGRLVGHLASRTVVVLTFLTQRRAVLQTQVCGYGRKLRRSCVFHASLLGLNRGCRVGFNQDVVFPSFFNTLLGIP